MKRFASAAVVACGLLGLTAPTMNVAAGPTRPQTPAPAAERVIVGILERIDTFAPSTGWQIQGRGLATEVDPSAVMRQANRLQNRKVRATGYFHTVQYPQGAVQVFVITRLERA